MNTRTYRITVDVEVSDVEADEYGSPVDPKEWISDDWMFALSNNVKMRFVSAELTTDEARINKSIR